MSLPATNNLPTPSLPLTVMTSWMIVGRLSSSSKPISLIGLKSIVVSPVTSPLITSLSIPSPLSVKSASRMMRPPPAKSPVTVRASMAPRLLPTLSVAPAVTLSTPAVRVWLPLPKLIAAPAPMRTVSQPVTFVPSSEPDTPLSERVLARLFGDAFSSSMPARSVPSSVRLSESSASMMSPLIVAPLSTTTLSQPFSPSLWTVWCRLPLPLLNLSVSVPAPPSISVMEVNVPPANVSVSVPPPSLTLPVIEAPVFTVTAVLPPDPTIALFVPTPTDAPLLSTMDARDETSVLIAATPLPAPPVTAVVTVTVVAPLPS